jgi:hypothetical protein
MYLSALFQVPANLIENGNKYEYTFSGPILSKMKTCGDPAERDQDRCNAAFPAERSIRFLLSGACCGLFIILLYSSTLINLHCWYGRVSHGFPTALNNGIPLHTRSVK